METVKTFADLVAEWKHAKEAASFFKEEERKMRDSIIAAAFAGNNIALQEGTNALPLADGTTVKVVHKMTRKVDVSTYGALREPLGDAAFYALFVHKPELSVSAYKELASDVRHSVDACLTIKPATPTLEIA